MFSYRVNSLSFTYEQEAVVSVFLSHILHTQELKHSSAVSWVLSALFHTPHSPSHPLTLTGTCRATVTAQYLWLETAG